MNFLVLVPKPHFPQMLFKDMSVFAEHKAEGFLLSALLSVFGDKVQALLQSRGRTDAEDATALQSASLSGFLQGHVS